MCWTHHVTDIYFLVEDTKFREITQIVQTEITTNWRN